ncbi:MAG: hypothetical protein U9R28_03050 [Pseudomonadota bacterium]|nr:hypothetical protein [Pseudomonadota bacterium]
MKRYLGLLGSLIVSSSIWAAEITPFVEVSSFSHSEPISVSGLMNNWKGSFETGRVAFTMNRAEIGVGVNNWQISVFNRYDYLFEFAPSTAKLFYDTKNKKELVSGEEYSLDLDSNSFVARGFKLGYQQEVSGFNVGVAVSYLEGLELTDGYISGRAVAVSENDYDFDFDVDYYYSEDSVFEREVEALPKGQGFGIDLDVNGYLNPQWQASLQVRDLFAQINWLETPRTIATGSSSTKEYDSDGYAVFKPVASGWELNEDYTQTIPTKLFLLSSYEFMQQHALLLEYQDYAIKSFYSAGYRFTTENRHNLDVFYNITAEAWKLRYQNPWMNFEMITDRLSVSEAQTIGLNLALRYSF